MNLDKAARTVSDINAVLARLGYDGGELEFVRGEGYFYVFGDAADDLDEQGIYTAYLKDLTKRQWVESALQLLLKSRSEEVRLRAQKAMSSLDAM